MSHADVFRSLRPASVTVTCFEQPWELSLNNAYQWVGALGWDLDTLTGIFPGSIADDDLDSMWAASVQYHDADRRWLNAARVALGRGSGRDWWWALNLSKRCLQGWPYINGILLRQGVNAQQLGFPDWLDAAYSLLWERADEEGKMKLDLELSMLPVGVAIRRSPQQTRKMLEAFAAD